jgi:hypothetical protein
MPDRDDETSGHKVSESEPGPNQGGMPQQEQTRRGAAGSKQGRGGRGGQNVPRTDRADPSSESGVKRPLGDSEEHVEDQADGTR